MSEYPIEDQKKVMEVQKKVVEKLGKIQSELFVPKDQSNDYRGFKYRTCEDILAAAKPICEKYKTVLRLGDAIPVEVGDRIYIKTTVQLYDLESCSAINATAYAREEESKAGFDGSQVTGASISYARKYALAGLFCIDNERDSDSTNTGKDQGKKTSPKETKETEEAAGSEKIAKREVLAIKAELERTGVGESVVCDAVGKKKLQDFTHADYLSVIKRLNNTSSKKEDE